MIGKVLLAGCLFGIAQGATLPQLNDPPWRGWYTGLEARGFRFGVGSDGSASMIPMKDRENAESKKKWIKVSPVVEVATAAGKKYRLKPLDDGWEAVTPSSDEAEEVVFRGTVKGGGKFEVKYVFERGELVGSGRLLEKGDIKGTPRFCFSIMLPNVNPWERDEAKAQTTAEDDRNQFVRVDGTKLKFDGWEEVDLKENPQTKEGISEIRIDSQKYVGRIELDAGPNAVFELWNRQPDSLYKGFSANWFADVAKDPQGKAQFVLKVK